MEHRISVTDLSRNVPEVLRRVRQLGDTFVIERYGKPIARISPTLQPRVSLREAIEAWRSAGPADPGFADDLDLIGASLL